MQGTQVWSLVRELRSHVLAEQLSPHGTTTKPVRFGARVPHTESLNATTTEPVCFGAHVPHTESLNAATTEPARHNQRVRALQQETPRDAKIPNATTKTPCSQINKYFFKEKIRT